MPPKRAVESNDVPECILRIGKYNNVVALNLEMRSVVGTLYGSTANFLTDNVRYVPPYPREEDSQSSPSRRPTGPGHTSGAHYKAERGLLYRQAQGYGATAEG